MTAKKATASKPDAVPDPQLVTTGPLFEVLTQAANGHRTVHRVHAKDRAAAETAISGELGSGTVVGVALAGSGLGSGDAA